MPNKLIDKTKLKNVLRSVLGRLCKVPLKDDKTEQQEYDEWKAKQENAERQKKFRDKWKKECQIGRPSDRPNPKKPTDGNKNPLPRAKKTKKKSPYTR